MDFVAGIVVAVVELELSNVELEVELARGSSAMLSHLIKVCDKIRGAPDEPHHCTVSHLDVASTPPLRPRSEFSIGVRPNSISLLPRSSNPAKECRSQDSWFASHFMTNISRA